MPPCEEPRVCPSPLCTGCRWGDNRQRKSDRVTDSEMAQKPWYKKWWVIGIGIFFLIGFLGSMGDAAESGSTTTTTPAVAAATPTTEAPETTTTTVAAASTTTVAPEPTTTVAPRTTQPEPQFTRSEENAIQKAADYLDYTAFSRSGLIDQLEYEGFTTADATLGVDYPDTDWNEQAWKKAEDYLDYTAFSRSGLIDQLEFEGFTTEQATYGVDMSGL